jgi:hypothetical protein
LKLKTSNFLVRSIAALLGLWLVVCGLGLGVGGGRLLAGVEGSIEETSGCCARKATVAPCCVTESGKVADCCVQETSGRPDGMPGLPVPTTANPLPEWVPTVVVFLELPDLALQRATPVASWVDEGFVVPVPLFLRDRVFLI